MRRGIGHPKMSTAQRISVSKVQINEL